MNLVSETDTPGAVKQATYAACRAAWVANLPRVVETPGQELWMIYRKPVWRAER